MVRTFDRWLVALGSVLFVGAMLYVARGAIRDSRAGGGSPFVAAFTPGTVDAIPAGYAVEELPPGVRIDPDTLELVGLNLDPGGGDLVLPWARLRDYEYQEGLAGLPEAVRAWDGHRAVIAGFMLPLYQYDDIREFHLVASHWSCCYGVPPGITGWIAVTLDARERGLPHTVDPIRVTGTFRVREQREGGYLMAIYALEDAEAAVLR